MVSTAGRSLPIRFVIAVVAASLPFTVSPQELVGTNVDFAKNAIDEYRRNQEGAILADFVELLSMRNVAVSLPDMERNADHIIGLLEPRGFTTRRLSAGGAPYIYAELTSPGAAETILIYAHFDGQPVQEENWEYPPFSPTLLDGPVQGGGQPVDIDQVDGPFGPEWRLYARSAGDDKMPIVALVHALDALAANDIDLSVNLKLLLDGEEEIGSPTVGKLIDENSSLLDADLLLFFFALASARLGRCNWSWPSSSLASIASTSTSSPRSKLRR